MANDARERVVEAAEQWMQEHGYKCLGVPLHYETESHVGYQYPNEFAADFALAHSADLQKTMQAWRDTDAQRAQQWIKEFEDLRRTHQLESTELQRRLDEAEQALCEMSRITGERDAAEAKTERYRLALEQFGRHKKSCHRICMSEISKRICTCGFEQALSGEVKHGG